MARSLSWSVCIQTRNSLLFVNRLCLIMRPFLFRGCVWHITHSENETSRFCVCACVCVSVCTNMYNSAVKALAKQADKAVRSEAV